MNETLIRKARVFIDPESLVVIFIVHGMAGSGNTWKMSLKIRETRKFSKWREFFLFENTEVFPFQCFCNALILLSCLIRMETNNWLKVPRNHSFSTYAKFSEKKLTFITPWYAHVRVRSRGIRNVSFPETFAYLLNERSLNRIIYILFFSIFYDWRDFNSLVSNSFSPFQANAPFLYPLKCQKTFCFPAFSGGIGMKHWL